MMEGKGFTGRGLAKFVALLWLRSTPPHALAFAPIHQHGGNLLSNHNHNISPTNIRAGRTTPLKSSYVSDETIAAADVDDAQQTSQAKKGFSYAAVLKVIDESHNNEANEFCSYLATEVVTPGINNFIGDATAQEDVQTLGLYHSPDTPVLSLDSVKALRNAAESYFEENRESGYAVRGIERVDLEDLLALNGGVSWKDDINDALMQTVYPLVRSGWPSHDAFTNQQSDSSNKAPVLTVTSASIFAGGGDLASKVAMTTLERDAGLFTVHIDLGNHADDNSVMGALFLESLVGDGESQANKPIVGPLSPGQVVVHRSMERTAAMMVPSNIHSFEGYESRLDSPLRTTILQGAERVRHYSLRLVLTTKTDATDMQTTPEAPQEERSYRLRSYSRFSDDRARYLTLAGLLDVDDYENHLWLGFDYIARIDNPDYHSDVRERLSDINKAVFHLEKAAGLCSTDARVQFQLASAMKAKMDCEKQLLMEASTDENEFKELERRHATDELEKVAKALERSAQIESAAVRLGINDIQDLAINCNAWAETLCKMGEFDKAMNVIDQWAECGSIRSKMAIEDFSIQLDNMPSYEWIQTQGNEHKKSRNVAVRTIGDVPVFEPEDVALLRAAADRRFTLLAGKQTSRYTMQYEGNSEVHLDDLCAGDPMLKARMDRILKEKVYPVVRAAFSEDGEDKPPLGPLCVYDSIFVRYNGDVAKAAGRIGASQPLHQDGGIYSVNIALNAHRDDDENGFTGGGTFLEALTVDDGEHIKRPVAPGHAILHRTTQRHAGAPTTSGIRDILVIFLTARRPSAEVAENTWRIESAMRLQSIAKELQTDKLVPFLRLARSNDPNNNEIPYWLGVHLVSGDSGDPSDERWEQICEGVEMLKVSSLLNPADARAHYHLGMGISSRHKYAMRTKRAHLLPPAKEAAETLINALETAIRLERECEKAGCKNGINIAAAYLCLGDFCARLKDYNKAILYLNQVEEAIQCSGDMDKNWSESLLMEVSNILQFCQKETAK